MSWRMRYVVGALVVLCLGVILGCGQWASSPGPTVTSDRVQALSVDPYPPTGQYYRLRDVIDNVYSDEFKGSFSYQTGMVTHNLTGGASLQGQLEARGLKPNFAYQVKLEGQPTAPRLNRKGQLYDLNDVNNWSNEQLGKLGRWWCLNCQWNVSDSQLGQHKTHTVLGYLVFDFFVTDGLGNADVGLYLDSSLHVLWRTDQRTPGANDGQPRQFTVQSAYDPISSELYAYPAPVGPTPVEIYAEWEPDRPLPGDAKLPYGSYKCRLLLTEESFHNVPPELASKYPWGRTSYADGGFWAHALSDEGLAFNIVPESETVTITNVAYRSANKLLTVEATSSLGGASKLWLDYKGTSETSDDVAMTYNSTNSLWKWSGKVSPKPTMVRVYSSLTGAEDTKPVP